MAFIRQVEVTIGPKGGEGVSINGLQIAFEIEKTDKPEANSAHISIYNLSKDTHDKICVAGNHCTLKAGYADETIAAILFGDVVKGTRKKSGMDYVTELEVKDGRAAVMAGQVSVSYAKDTDALTIAQDMIDAIGLPSKGAELIPSGANYPGAFSGMGQAADILREVLNKYDLKYTIQNEMIYILKEGEASKSTGLRLTPETGLLTIPQPVSDKTEETDTTKEAANTWTFRTMLFPLLIDVPVLFPGTKKWTLHFPLEKDDEVAVFFSERALEAWKDSGQDGIEDPDPRRYSLSDAYCIPGLQPQEFIAATESGLQIIHKDTFDGELISQVLMTDDKVEVQYKEKAGVLIQDDAILAMTETCSLEMSGDTIEVKNSKDTFEMAGQVTLKVTGAELLDIGNAIATLGGILDELCAALSSLHTEGAPASHTASAWAASSIAPLRVKCNTVFKT
jgi:hypothetical protein